MTTFAKYVWEHLDAAPLNTDDLPSDIDSVLQQLSIAKEQLAIHEELLLERDEIIQQQTEHLETVKKVSTETFEKLQTHIHGLEQEIKACQKKEMIEEDDELLYLIACQFIISRKQGLIKEACKKRTTAGVIRALQQRANVIKYLEEREMWPDLQTRFKKLLFIDSNHLLSLINQYIS